MILPRLRQSARNFVERVPFAAKTYRDVRNAWTLRSSTQTPTPFGFRLAGHEAMASGAFEPEETAFLESKLQTSDVFVDVGANVGFYVCLAATRGTRVIAIEPLRENQDYLYRNVEHNGLRDVEIFPMAVGDTAGLLPIYGGATGASLVSGWAGATKEHRTTVPITTLDTILGDRFEGRRLLLKVDVEGAELAVVRGAARTLARHPRPIWMIEVCLTEHHPDGLNRDFGEVFETMWNAGYRAFTIGKERREIHPTDVARWTTARRKDFGGHNYEFSSD